MKLCKYLCEEVGVVVVAPDYRKAPRTYVVRMKRFTDVCM